MQINNVRFVSASKAVCDLFETQDLKQFVAGQLGHEQHYRVVRVVGTATVEIALEPEEEPKEGATDGH